MVAYENLYVLSYATEKQCKKAYKKLSENDSLVVEVDAVMETETAEKAEKTDASENSEKSGFTTKDTELKTYLDTLKNTQNVNVAVLDTGVDVSKEVFKDRIVETELNLSSSGEDNSTHDDNGHGTAMAEIICESSSNKVKIMPIKVANADGKATILNVYQGVLYAMENGADVINLSMNTFKSATSQILTDAIDEATKKGIAVVVSAGNDNINTKYITPADVDSAIVVGAVNDNKTIAVYSNHGDTLDYVSYGGYEGKEGTSYATAQVTGMIASLLSKGQEISVLDEYAVDLGKEGWDKEFGNGFLSLYDYVEQQEEEKEQENQEEQKQPEDGADGSTEEGATEENDSNTNTEVDTERKPAVLPEDAPEDAFESTIFDVDWKTLSDEKLNEILMASEEAHMAVWLQNLSEEDLKLVLSKQTFLTGSLITYGFEKDENGKNIVDDVNVDESGEKQESYLLEETGSQPYYKYLLDIDFSEMSISEFEYINGYYTLEIVGGGKEKSSIRIKTTLENKSIFEESQTVTYSIVIGETTNNHDFKLRSTAGENKTSVTGSTVPGQESDKSKSDGKTSYVTKEGNTIWKSKTYGVYFVNGTYRQPAYTYPTGSVTSPNPTLRMNFQEYNWMNTGTATLRYRGIYHNDVSVTSSDAHVFTMQVHSANAGQSCVPGVTGGHGTMRITLNYPTLTIKYNKNGASIDNSSSTKDLDISTATTTVSYDGSSKADLINFGRFGLVQTGYHRVSGKEWNLNANGTGTIFNQDSTYLATAFKDFANGDRFENNTVTVYAQFDPNTLTVKYNANGGSVNTSDSTYSRDINTYTDNWNYNTAATHLKYPGTFGLYRDGWHIKEGKEWGTTPNAAIDNSGNVFNKATDYRMTIYAPNLISGNQTVTVYAQWEKNKSTLKINPNGGTWMDTATGINHTSLTSPSFTQEYETIKYVSDPTTTDKYVITFNGNLGKVINPTTNAQVVSLPIDSNKYFTGWTVAGNAGTFSNRIFTFGPVNGGSGTMTANWAYANIVMPDATRTGYTFKGWYTAATGGTFKGKAGNGYATEPAGSITLYAQWEPNKSILKINPNGGIWKDPDTGTEYSTLTKGFEQAYGTTKTIPDAERPNYTVSFVTYSSNPINPISTTWEFDKWIDTASGKEAGLVGNTDTFAGTFVHDKDNKTGQFIYGANNNGSGVMQAKWLGTNKIILPKPEREGYVFTGWENGSVIVGMNGDEYIVTENTILVATWEMGYEIAYDGNGATHGTVPNTICIYNKTASLSRNWYSKIHTVTFDENYQGAPVSKTLKEATFQGWGRNVNGTYNTYGVGDPVYNWTNVSGTIIHVEAIWSPLSVTLPALNNRTGYEFRGWNDSREKANSGIVSDEAGKTVPVTKDVTYHAVWEREKYDMTYHANDGTDKTKVDVKGKTYGVKYKLKDNTVFSKFERSGYKFVGWSNMPDETNPEYKIYQLRKNDDGTEDFYDQQGNTFAGEGPTDFYAVWERNTIKVAYMMNTGALTAEEDTGYTMSGQNFIDGGEGDDGILMTDAYTMDDNSPLTMALDVNDAAAKQNFFMSGVYQYRDAGDNIQEEKVTATVVGWAFNDYSDVNSVDYELGETVEKAESIYNDGNVLGNGAITQGKPSEDFYKKADGSDAESPAEEDEFTYANLYAIYDYGPKVHANPLYYTLYVAQSGGITWYDLISRVKVFDTEDSNICPVENIPEKQWRMADTTYYTIIDYQSWDFTQLESDSMVTITYEAVDSAGNVTRKRIPVTIVDVEGSVRDTEEKEGESRFISYKYLWTLDEDSIWLTEPYFTQLVSGMIYEEVDPEIKAAYPHIYNERTEALAYHVIDVEMSPPIPIFGDMFSRPLDGTQQFDRPPVQVWKFTHEDIVKIKQFVEEHGFTTYADTEELDLFLEEFDYCFLYEYGFFRHDGVMEEPEFYKEWFGDKLGIG